MGETLFKSVKKVMTSSSFRYYVILKCGDSLAEVNRGLHCFFVFPPIRLKFGVEFNFGLLISNLSSKT